MASLLGKLEGMVTIPTGGYTVTVSEGGGAIAVVIPAGDYYITSGGASALLTTIGATLTASASLAGTYTLSLDDGSDSSVGRITIAVAGATVTSWAWTSTELMAVLGFRFGQTLVGTSLVGDYACPYVHLPEVPRSDSLGPSGTKGKIVTDGTVTVAPSGYAKALVYTQRWIDTYSFKPIRGRKAKTSLENTVNESWQTFFALVPGLGVPMRWHADRTDDSTYVTIRSLRINDEGCDPLFPSMRGAQSLWRVDFDAIEHL